MNSSPKRISINEILQKHPELKREDLLAMIAYEAELSEKVPFIRENTLHKALGLAATDEPAPTDAEVEQWLDEHRLERYG